MCTDLANSLNFVVQAKQICEINIKHLEMFVNFGPPILLLLTGIFDETDHIPLHSLKILALFIPIQKSLKTET